MKKVSVLFFLMILLLIPNCVFAANEVNIYFFHSDECSICNQEKAYLEALQKRYPNMRIYSYEISEYNDLMLKAKEIYKEERAGVPYTIIGDSAYLGFSQNSKALFQKKVYEYSKTSYQNLLGQELGIGYRNDLAIEVEEYKENSEYQIEERPNHISNSTTSKRSNTKDKVSLYLIGAGILLAILAVIISIYEKRKQV